MTNKEILLHLRKQLTNEHETFMCFILRDIGLPCKKLKEIGLEDEWLAMGHTIDYAWSDKNFLKKSSSYHVPAKIECINRVLNRDYPENN